MCVALCALLSAWPGLRCGFVVFVFWLWLLAGLYCRFIEARLVEWLRQITESPKASHPYEEMELWLGPKKSGVNGYTETRIMQKHG